MPKTQYADPLLETLTRLSLGEISLEQAAAVLDTSTDDLADFIDASPQLVAEADARALTKRMDPQRVLEKSHEGLAQAVTALTDRITRDAGEMATSELVAAAKTLESLTAFSKAREAELKSKQTDDEPALPLLIEDRRIEGQFRLYLVPPTSCRWVDVRKSEFQAPTFSWLDHFMPLADGRVLDTKALLNDGIRYMDAYGRVFGG